MENQQIKIEEVKSVQPVNSEEKPKPFFAKMAKLEKEVARLEKQIDIIIKSLKP